MIVFTNIRTKSEHRYLIHTEPKEKIVAGHIELSQRNLEEKQK